MSNRKANGQEPWKAKAQDLWQKLSPEDRARVEALLQNESEVQKILRTPQAQALFQNSSRSSAMDDLSQTLQGLLKDPENDGAGAGAFAVAGAGSGEPPQKPAAPPPVPSDDTSFLPTLRRLVAAALRRTAGRRHHALSARAAPAVVGRHGGQKKLDEALKLLGLLRMLPLLRNAGLLEGHLTAFRKGPARLTERRGLFCRMPSKPCAATPHAAPRKCTSAPRCRRRAIRAAPFQRGAPAAGPSAAAKTRRSRPSRPHLHPRPRRLPQSLRPHPVHRSRTGRRRLFRDTVCGPGERNLLLGHLLLLLEEPDTEPGTLLALFYLLL